MLSQLQGYLLQYGSVCIPSVGTFRLVQQPATLDVVHQQLLPPRAEVVFDASSNIPDHQLQAFSTSFNNDIDATEHALQEFGAAMNHQLQQQPFVWQGIGSLSAAQQQVVFIPAAEELAAVPAHRVLRENVQHAVLVGDQEQQRSADDYMRPEEVVAPRRSPALIIALVITLLTICFAGYHLYSNGGRVKAAGLQQKIKVQTTPVQYK